MPDQSSEKDLRLAVLIDADNASRTAMKDVMAEVAVYGTPTIKRIYGDWTSPNMSTWKSILLETAITPIQQYSYTTGKNATDSAMIIDAMDYKEAVELIAFCRKYIDEAKLTVQKLQTLEEKMDAMTEKLQQNQNADGTNSYYKLGAYARDIYLQFQKDWSGYRKNLTVEYHWDVTLVTSP